ncbi:response regulator [Streptomyces sp. NPDC054813]
MSATPTRAADAIRVLIVDDEPEPTELLSVAVTAAGWRPFVAQDGYGALRTARRYSPHAVVLDGMLPDLDGIQVPRRLRYENTRLPVLMLTARDAVEYVRVHSPVVWVEVGCQAPGPLRGAYGGTQGVPTQMHVHSVIRTPNGNDYGKELIRRHCLTSPHHR